MPGQKNFSRFLFLARVLQICSLATALSKKTDTFSLILAKKKKVQKLKAALKKTIRTWRIAFVEHCFLHANETSYELELFSKCNTTMAEILFYKIATPVIQWWPSQELRFEITCPIWWPYKKKKGGQAKSSFADGRTTKKQITSSKTCQRKVLFGWKRNILHFFSS